MSTRRTALVTGGTKGIGQAVALRLQRDGWRVHITYHGDAAAAESARAAGLEAHRLDVRDAEAAAALVAELGAIDALINNAGVVIDQFLRFANDADWHASLAVNLEGAARLSALVLPGMRARRWGRLVSVSSYVGRAGAAGRAGYAASKAGLLGLTRALARAEGPFGITANAVCPGLVWTERTRAYRAQVLERSLAEIPLGRGGEPEEVAGLVAYLLSEQAGYMTGQALGVDGGLYTGGDF